MGQMIGGEGSVFLALLIIGIYKTKEAFRKEFNLARHSKPTIRARILIAL